MGLSILAINKFPLVILMQPAWIALVLPVPGSLSYQHPVESPESVVTLPLVRLEHPSPARCTWRRAGGLAGGKKKSLKLELPWRRGRKGALWRQHLQWQGRTAPRRALRIARNSPSPSAEQASSSSLCVQVREQEFREVW